MKGFTHIRDQFGVKRTTGILYYNNQPLTFPFEGRQANVFICEDVCRPHGIKIPKETALWDGEYFLTITHSNRFKQRMPLIYNYIDPVKGMICKSGSKIFEGSRQHIGNTEADTESCQLMGFTRNENGVFTSTKCFEQYLPWLEEELKKYPDNKIPYTIINQQP